MTIKTFRNEASRDVATALNSKRARQILPVHLHPKALLLLSVLHAARRLEDLMISPGWHLEKLLGDRRGRYSLRINKQYRVCFTWTGSDAENVEIIDYHR
ncbi:type II toxin-antitoxin system RelE/ParE family toxin [bacterium]|nr:type II toxin-antitoxin system RelE/ParE family toxin [bacterium]